MGSKKKPPPSEGRTKSRLSLFKSPYNLMKASKAATSAEENDRLSAFRKRSLFTDTESTASCETRDDFSNAFPSNHNIHNTLFDRDNKNNRTNIVSPIQNSPKTSSTMDLNPLQSEVCELRQKLKEVGSHNRRSELLLGQMKVLEEESQRKDEKLRHLNDKLHGIQRGLSQIDDERSQLQQQIQQLEDNKLKTQRQLDLREQEVLTLVKRCSTQEDKMRESILLRCRNEELSNEIGELRTAMAEQEFDRNRLEETTKELEDCQKKLEHSRRDHDALADTLHNCLANIKNLTNEKLEWEDERRRLMNRAEVEIEKERLQHVEDMNDLKVQLQNRQSKIDKLETFMKDKSMTNLMLRKENAELNKWKTKSTTKVEEHERQIAKLIEENKQKRQEMEERSVDQQDWITQLEEKDKTIAALEQDISLYMTRSMATSEELEILQEESIELEELVEKLQAKVKSFDAWEEERDAMKEFLAVTQTQIQELMEEVVTLQLENDDLEDEKQELLNGMKSADTCVSEQVERLEKELATKESNWRQLEEHLRKEIALLESKRCVSREGLETKLTTAQETIRTLEWTVATRTKDSMELRKALEESRDAGAEKVDKIISLESDMTEIKHQFECCDSSRQELQNQTKKLVTNLDDTHKQLKESQKAIDKLKTQVAEQQEEYLSTRDAFVHIAEEDTAYFQNEKAALRQKLDETQALNRELEEKLSTTNSTQEKDFGKMDKLLSTRDNELQKARQALEESDEDLVLLQKNLEEVKSSHHEEVSCLRALLQVGKAQTDSLRAELQKTKTDLVLKDDEIRELQMVELQDYEEEVSSLQQEVSSKKSDINDLTKKLQELSLQQLEREHAVAEEVGYLKSTISQLKEERQNREEESCYPFGKNSEKLESTSVALRQKNQRLEQSITSRRMELGLAAKSGNDNKEQQSKLQTALVREISLNEATEKDLIASKGRVKALEAAVSDLKSEKENVEGVLRERSGLLGKMVEINKALKVSADCLSGSSKQELTELRRERKELSEATSRERILREVLEAELSTMHRQMMLMKKQGKDNSSLRTENAEWHTNSQCQDAFLRKARQKEKAMRDRTSSANVVSASGRQDLRSTVKNIGQPNLHNSVSENLDPSLSIMGESNFQITERKLQRDGGNLVRQEKSHTSSKTHS